MAANSIIKGRNLMCFIGEAASCKAIAYATTHTLSITGETTDISSKDHGIYGAVDVNKVTWEISSENLFTTEDFSTLFNLMTAGTQVTLQWGINKDASLPVDTGTMWTIDQTKGYYTGKAVITSLQVNANNGETATFSVTFTGAGAITYKKS